MREELSQGGKRLSWALTATIWAVLFTPLVFSRESLFPFQTGKGFAARVLVELGAFLYAWLLLLEPRLRPKTSMLLWAILAYVMVVLLCTLAGVGPYRSFWGNLERMEGLFGLLHAAALFFIVGAILRARANWLRFFEVSLVASLCVAVAAIAEIHAVAQSLPSGEWRRYRPMSTIGHSEFLATYAIFQCFFALFLLLWERVPWRRWVAGGLLLLNFVTLTLAASRGAWVGIYAGSLVGVLLCVTRRVFPARARAVAIAMLVLLVAAPLTIRAMHGSDLMAKMPYVVERLAATSLSDPTTATRLRSLRMSYDAFVERPLLGWGLEHFSVAFNRHFDPQRIDLEQWFDRAHNKLVDVLVESGLLGLVTYLAIFTVAGAGLARILRQADNAADIALGIATVSLVTAYFVQNLFLFDTQTTTFLFFCSLGFVDFLAASWRGRAQAEPAVAVGSPGSGQAPALRHAVPVAVMAVVTLALMGWANVIPYREALLGRESTNAQTPPHVLDSYRRAVAYGGFATAEVTRAVEDALIDNGRARSPEWTSVFDALREGIERTLAREPTDLAAFIRAGSLYNERTEIDPSYLREAERVLTAAVALSPNRPDVYYGLGVTYLKGKDYGKAHDVFRFAAALDPRNQWARWGMGLASLASGEMVGGSRDIEQALGMGADWDVQPEVYLLTNIYATRQPPTKLIDLYAKVIELRPGVAKYRVMIAMAYADAGLVDEARAAASKAVELDPAYAADARQFIERLPAPAAR